MRRFAATALFAVIGFGILAMGCMDREPAPVCPVPTEIAKTEKRVGNFDGLDMLVVVDNSGSMGEEQQILATSFFTMVNALVNPLPDWKFEEADDVRIGVVSSDMGLQYGNDGSLPPDNFQSQFGCPGKGDDGQFQTYGSGKAIDIDLNLIECDVTGAQCPSGWNCVNVDQGTGVGVCTDPVGDGTNQVCPGLGATWAQTPMPGTENDDNPTKNADLAFQVACLGDLGTAGCGFEQQLQAAAKGLNVNGNFIREEALLAVLIVSDEEDCSIQDGGGLFATSELNNVTPGEPHYLNVACGRHEDLLYSVDHYKTTFINAKNDVAGAVIFAAIVGVPFGNDPGADSCQGRGSDIGSCLDPGNGMELEEVLEQGATSEYYVFKPACTRTVEGNPTPVTKARPGRRYVALAQQMGSMSYIYSICNEDWGRAMEDIAELIAENLSGTCYPKPLDWDPVTQQAKCDVVVEYEDLDECPFELEDGAIATEEEWTDAEDVQHTSLYCPLPRLAAPRGCAGADELYGPGGSKPNAFGWYYCEDNAENFNEACDPAGEWAGLDEDEDGLIDCDDPDCQNCDVCPGGTGVGCRKSCKFVVQLTKDAEALVSGQQVAVQCLQQFSFEDPNCQENSEAACNDEKDNDGNGVWDCDQVSDGDTPHAADANCCPMTVAPNNDCVLGIEGVEVADVCPDSPAVPDACVAKATQLRCNPTW